MAQVDRFLSLNYLDDVAELRALRVDLLPNVLGQLGQLKFLSPVWTTKWEPRWNLLPKTLSQWGQGNCPLALALEEEREVSTELVSSSSSSTSVEKQV